MPAGGEEEFVFVGRLDNLCMSWCSLQALIDACSEEGSLDGEQHQLSSFFFLVLNSFPLLVALLVGREEVTSMGAWTVSNTYFKQKKNPHHCFSVLGKENTLTMATCL